MKRPEFVLSLPCKDAGRKWSSIGRAPPTELGLVSTIALDSEPSELSETHY